MNETADKLKPARTTRRRVAETQGPLLGKTLPDLLYDACARYENPNLYARRTAGTWETLSLDAFRIEVEEVAMGLLDYGIERGDRVAMYMESDTLFCVADMGCLLAGLIDVPIYLSQAPATNAYILRHSGAVALFVTSMPLLEELNALLAETDTLKTIVVAEPPEPKAMTLMPEGVQWVTMDRLRKRGRERIDAAPDAIARLRSRIQPGDLATIVYTSGTTGEPKGVMLSHENISCNGVTAVSELGDFEPGAGGEISLSFLPLSHIFARTLYYGVLYFGVTTYFSNPDRLSDDLVEVRPTLFITVPRLLEKIYARILEKATTLQGLKKKLLNWSLELAGAYSLDDPPAGTYRFQLKLADALVFKKWRAGLGGRIKYIISGGAALNADLANLFAAADVKVLQGYGLTETSPVIAFNRPTRNRAGTVGELLPGVEVKIAEDGEIITRGPHVMQGYYKNPDKTREVIDAEGWFHTGDIGEMSPDGYLRITDRKKDLFKLSTGKYVMPQPLENKLLAHPLVEQAVVVGAGYKYCAALIFVNQETLKVFAASRGLDPKMPVERLVEEPQVLDRYQQMVDAANEDMDHWSTIKRFKLVADHLSIENGMLTPTLKVKRARLREAYADQIKALYPADEGE
ncbi:MAG: long-chain fatty acid--CoA ligase [Rhodothermales bacterium]